MWFVLFGLNEEIKLDFCNVQPNVLTNTARYHDRHWGYEAVILGELMAQ